MNSFKNVRELLLLSPANNVVSDREFVILYDAYQSKNPDFNYQQYDPFNLDNNNNNNNNNTYRAPISILLFSSALKNKNIKKENK